MAGILIDGYGNKTFWPACGNDAVCHSADRKSVHGPDAIYRKRDPGLWGESFVEGSENVINYALDHTFRGTWYVLLGSSVAFIVSSIVNNELNWLIVSHNFFGWTMTQCIMCAVTGAVVELICEVIFSPIGYRVAKRWKKREVGKLYIDYIREKGGRVA